MQSTPPRWKYFASWLWHQQSFIWITLVLGTSMNVATTLLTTSGFDPKGTPIGWLLEHPWWSGVAFAFLLLQACFAWWGQRGLQPASISLRDAAAKQKHRERLIWKVQTFWVKDVFEKSLYQATLIVLGLKSSPEAISNPWRLVFQESPEASFPLPPNTHILKVYDEAQGELLILGEPGAGKTTLLLELARDLLKRAEKNKNAPVPVVLNLSSWSRKRQPLLDWLKEEIETKYTLPRDITSAWIQSNQILFLLDGLDEVAQIHRAACIRAIDDFYRKNPIISFVICCRTNEYTSQSNQLSLERAVTIQPLTKDQINKYFVRLGTPVKSLNTAYKKDPILQGLATTPLMLNILIMTYHGKPLHAIKGSATSQVRQQEIFALYTTRMLSRRKSSIHYPLEHTQFWLSWLAKQMKERNQTEFYLERLQFDWLPKNKQNLLYPCLAVGIASFLVDIAIDGILYGSITAGLLIALFKSVLVFLVINGIVWGRLTQPKKKGLPFWAAMLAWVLEKRVTYGIICGLLAGVFVGFLEGPTSGFLNGLLSSLFFGLLGKVEQTIQAAETIRWSWKTVRKNAISILLTGVGIGVFYGAITGFPHLSEIPVFGASLLFGVCVGMIFGLASTLVGGFSKEILQSQNIVRPNQGIWHSFYHSLRLGLLSGLVASSFFYLFYAFLIYQVFDIGTKTYLPPNSPIIYSTANGLAVILLVWLISGGLACIQYLTLRLLLYRSHLIPWHYPRFLDYATEHILLRKVGGGYIFIHRLLLEYFASIEEQPLN